MWSVWLVLVVARAGATAWPPADVDCLTADGSIGQCKAPTECAPSFYSLKPVLCRYSRGYGMRICCPRPPQREHFSYSLTNAREDYSDDEPISFPDSTYTEFRPFNQPTTSSYNINNPLVFEDPDVQPSYNKPSYQRPSYSKPQYHEKPSYSSESSSPSYIYQERPDPSYGYQESPSPSYGYQERPSSTNVYQERPSFGSQGRPSNFNGYQGRPRPSYGSEESSNPAYGSESNSFRPKPPAWGASEEESSYESRPDRTTPSPAWSVEDSGIETSSSSNKRISEIKCEEYSRPVSLTIGVLPLSLNAEAVPLHVQKCDFSAVKLIVGGQPSEVGEFPHMAAVGFRTPGSQNIMWNCGGTLISERFVMTAGHCVNTSFGNPLVVRLGEYNLARDNDGAEPEDYRIERIIVHPNYFKSLKYNDIALLRLSRPVRFNKFIRPACLPADNRIRGTPIATGWGRTDFVGKQSDVLMKVSLSVIDNRQCNSFYSTNNPGSSSFSSGIVDTMLCAGEIEGGRDTCLGDSGGPLTVPGKDNPCVHYVVGITSFGKICGAPKSPGVYTRVSRYLSWIERTVWS